MKEEKKTLSEEEQRIRAKVILDRATAAAKERGGRTSASSGSGDFSVRMFEPRAQKQEAVPQKEWKEAFQDSLSSTKEPTWPTQIQE